MVQELSPVAQTAYRLISDELSASQQANADLRAELVAALDREEALRTQLEQVQRRAERREADRRWGPVCTHKELTVSGHLLSCTLGGQAERRVREQRAWDPKYGRWLLQGLPIERRQDGTRRGLQPHGWWGRRSAMQTRRQP